MTLPQTSETRVSAQLRAARTVACSEARHGLSVCCDQLEGAHVTLVLYCEESRSVSVSRNISADSVTRDNEHVTETEQKQ